MAAGVLALLAVRADGAQARQVAHRTSPGACKAGKPPSGPALAHNFPDPFVFCAHGRLYAVSTNSGADVPVATATHLSDWRLETEDGAPRDALNRPPPWAVTPPADDARDVWAPEVIKLGRTYVMFFSARHARLRTPLTTETPPRHRNRPCIGAATSTLPDRDYEPDPEPLLCPENEFPEGFIDPSPFRDGGRLYLYSKWDGNCCGARSEIFVSQLSLRV